MTRWDRFTFWLAGWVAYFFISVLGRSVRWESIGDSHLQEIHKSGNRAIFTFWHGRILPATYHFRNRGIVVMTSMSRDGEMIARCIERFGYGAARGSSSAGWLRALAEMTREIRRGRDTAFTVDGPRGPRYVAQQGPLILARKTGAAIFCFHISMKHKVQLKSWDEFQIPLPFTRAIVLQAAPIWVPPDASEAHLRDLHRQMQAALDELRAKGDSWW